MAFHSMESFASALLSPAERWPELMSKEDQLGAMRSGTVERGDPWATPLGSSDETPGGMLLSLVARGLETALSLLILSPKIVPRVQVKVKGRQEEPSTLASKKSRNAEDAWSGRPMAM